MPYFTHVVRYARFSSRAYCDCSYTGKYRLILSKALTDAQKHAQGHNHVVAYDAIQDLRR